MRASLFGRDKFFNLIAKKYNANLIIVLDSRKRKHGAKFGSQVLLLLPLGTKVFRSAHIHQQHNGKLALLVKHLYVRVVKAGGNIPVNGTYLVAKLVFAHLAKG